MHQLLIQKHFINLTETLAYINFALSINKQAHAANNYLN